MQTTLLITITLHVLAGVFWAGSTFVLARAGGDQAGQLFRPQMGAATVAVATGALLWYLVHLGDVGIQGHVLGVGALCAIIAAGVQGATAGPALRKLAGAPEAQASRLRARVATGQRIAAALLAVTVACMAAARYA